MWQRRWTVRLAATAAILAALTLIAASNFSLVELRLIAWQGEVRLSWIVLGAVALGFALGLLVARVRR